MDKKEFRTAIKRNGLSCNEFATMTGISIGTIYRYGSTSAVPRSIQLILCLLDERGSTKGLEMWRGGI